MIDNMSEPGSWDKELKAAPWGYGQNQSVRMRNALAEIRARGLWTEAGILEQEILTLQRELESIRGQT
jgi:hypothetical protein